MKQIIAVLIVCVIIFAIYVEKPKGYGEYDNGMRPTLWGPALWHFLHIVSFNYPRIPSAKEEAEHLIFIESLGHVIPCKKCRDCYQAIVNKFPPDMESRDSFSKWVYWFHNRINMKIGKATGFLTYEDVKTYYERMRYNGEESTATSRVIVEF